MEADVNNILTIILVILLIVIGILAVLYFVGRKLQTKQLEQKDAMEAIKQTVTMLIIDKKKLPLKDAGLPKIVYDNAPKHLRWMKVPVIKAKVGPKVMTLMADDVVFKTMPVKAEVKAEVSGLYITKIVSVRGGSVPKLLEKKGLFGKKKTNNK